MGAACLAAYHHGRARASGGDSLHPPSSLPSLLGLRSTNPSPSPRSEEYITTSGLAPSMAAVDWKRPITVTMDEDLIQLLDENTDNRSATIRRLIKEEYGGDESDSGS